MIFHCNKKKLASFISATIIILLKQCEHFYIIIYVVSEGRGKKKRKYGYVLVALATLAAVLLPFKLKAIALMAATALVVGKLALIVASLIGLKKLVSKQSEETTHVHYGHRSDPEAHYLAYQEQIPQSENRYWQYLKSYLAAAEGGSFSILKMVLKFFKLYFFLNFGSYTNPNNSIVF